MNEYIKGLFAGALLMCTLAYLFPKDTVCLFEMSTGKFTAVRLGHFVDAQ